MEPGATPCQDPRAANRALWDEWAEINYRSSMYDVEGFKVGGISLRPYEVEEVGDVAGKDLLHLQCHFGQDTLSWARLGARVTGVDFSERAIRYARQLATELGLPARFVQCDVLDLPANLSGDFDVVFTSLGVLGWLPDLGRWAQVIWHFLRPGGIFYVSDAHPIVHVFDDAEGVTGLHVRYPYFPRPEPLAFPVQGSYADRTAQVAQSVEYTWIHNLGEVVTALATAGLRIEFLHERPFLEWELSFLEARDGAWWLPEGTPGEIPLGFSLRASRPGPAPTVH